MPAPKSEEQQELDAALAASFPANDSPAMTAPATATSAVAADGDEELKRRPFDFFRVVPRAQSHSPFERDNNRSGGRGHARGVLRDGSAPAQELNAGDPTMTRRLQRHPSRN